MNKSEKAKLPKDTNSHSCKTKTPMDKALSVVRAYSEDGIETDPLGSWTGVPKDRNDRPVQDADDL